ncbi:ATP-dependent RNA helicase DHX37/DHR1 [Clonorchis sinensis]|uniref:RNA helicase n=1 Tax=Clonorchis sinensis TaxID=79923 RepID=G7Y709_CLOSI|nr:ATP-dependent RNA helicase DHX37/DHR1 [Clonorchis sinensis]
MAILRHMIEFSYDPTQYDPSNPLVLPAKLDKERDSKAKSLKRRDEVQSQILSKKKRKELERKLAQKQKKLSFKSVQQSPKPARYVLVSRTPDVVAARLTLPIIADEAAIMEAISQNDCIIICGATGCGKTTQVPQFLYEAGYSRDGYMIGITEPRRVAAISMSKRVSEELNLSSGQVSYHIRYEKTVVKGTEIKFMTDGVLLQEVKQDFELSRYSVIIVDEAHERSIYTDVLLGLLSLILRLRRRRYAEGTPTRGTVLPPLKLIIMSATLRVSDFSENTRLFPASPNGPPPVIQVESRQFPVTCHFAKVTQPDYLKAAFRKVIQIHENAPAGGILVFLTGQREVLTLCSWLSRAFPATTTNVISRETKRRGKNKKTYQQSKDHDSFANMNESISELDSTVSRINLDNFDIIPMDEETELGSVRPVSENPLKPSSRTSKKSEPLEDTGNHQVDSDLEEVEDDDDVLQEISTSRKNVTAVPIRALPLYSLLSPERQQLVFETPPEGHRLVVVATNVAETSLTIPNIRFVVDSGKVKTKVYDPATGASSFEIVWISQASAEQRAGRAGRVAPGQCYRLYSSQVFSSMNQFAVPDILTRPIDEVVLMLKSYLGSTPLSRFPLPTSPSAAAIEFAEYRLISLGALQETQGFAERGTTALNTITRAGRWMARLPLPARFARMLLFANQHQLMPYAVVLVAALSVPDLYINPNPEQSSEANESVKSVAEHFRTNFAQQFVRRREDLYFGDLAVLLGTVCCLERYSAQLNGLAPSEEGVFEACGGAKRVSQDPDGALKFLVERCGVRWNAYKEVRQLRRQLTDILNANVPDLCLTLDLVLPRPTGDQINQLRQLFLVGSPCHVASKFDVTVEGLPAKDRRRLRYAYKVPGVSGPVFIDSSSPLARENCPFIAFLELHRTSKPFLRTVCAVDPQWIPFLAPHNYKVEGVVVSDELSPASGSFSSDRIKQADTDPDQANTDVTPDTESLKPEKIQRLFKLPTPRYDADHDVVVTGAKRVCYLGTCASELEGDNGELELPNFSMLVPINSLACARFLGPDEAFTWSVRWFARALLEGHVFSEFLTWFPQRIKQNLTPTLMTVSWGLVRPEVRKLVSSLASAKVDNRRNLMFKWKTEPFCRSSLWLRTIMHSFLDLSRELASWLKPEFVADFHNKWPIVPVISGV